MLGERALRKLYTKEQRALFRNHAPDGIELDDLSALGPIFVLKLKWQPLRDAGGGTRTPDTRIMIPLL